MSRQSVHRILPYDPALLFALVADVEHYPQFVPGWVAARVIRRGEGWYETDQMVRIAGIRHRFQTHTEMETDRRIEVRSIKDSLADFHILWTFDETPAHACDAGILVEVSVHARVLDPLAHAFSGDAMRRLVDAFEKEAARRTQGLPA